MVCPIIEPKYSDPRSVGLREVSPRKDGYSFGLSYKPAASDDNYQLVYNIYYSTIRDDVYAEDPKLVIIDPNQTSLILTGFTPGDVYYFSVRASEFDIDDVNVNALPNNSDGYKVYPEGAIVSDIGLDDLIIPVGDIALFPPYGIVQIGYELIKYTNLDLVDGYLIVDPFGRGYLDSDARIHQTDGYDGYVEHDPIIKFWKGFEEDNTVIFQGQARFAYPNFPWTAVDGYRIQTDIITTDLSASDAAQVEFPRYDFAGYHRTNPLDLLRGKCLNTYIGGVQYCADGYGGVARQVRGLDLVERDQQRLEVQLETTGSPVVLFRRIWDGVTCKCVTISKESPESRCPSCLSTGMVGGYQQYFNTRRSDGRIMTRFDPAEEDIKVEDAGLENFIIYNCWTLAAPSLRDRDVIIQYDQDNNELWRYEVLGVTRNVLIDNEFGAQKFRAQRVRRTSPIYMLGANKNTATMPSEIFTSIAVVAGLPPHSHSVTISEAITDISQINQTTGEAAGHTHQIRNGTVLDMDFHNHTLIL